MFSSRIASPSCHRLGEIPATFRGSRWIEPALVWAPQTARSLVMCRPPLCRRRLFRALGNTSQLLVAGGFARATGLASCEDRGRLRLVRGHPAFLMFAIIPRHRAVAARLHGLPSGSSSRGHQPERAIALQPRCRTARAVRILAGPDIAARTILKRGDHVVDQRMIVSEMLGPSNLS